MFARAEAFSISVSIDEEILEQLMKDLVHALKGRSMFLLQETIAK